MALTDKLKAIADAIRGKTGETAEMTLDEMATAIEGISAGAETKMATVTITGLKTSTLSGLSGASSATLRYTNETGTGFASTTIGLTSTGAETTITVPVGGVIMIMMSGNASSTGFYMSLASTSGVALSNSIAGSFSSGGKYYKSMSWLALVKEETAGFTAKVY